MIAFVVILSLLVLICLYGLTTVGRVNHKGLQDLKSVFFAHRGLHGAGVPENSLEAFRLAKEHGYGVELDVHLLKDGELAVFHDTDLLRMTGKEGRIVDLTADELENYFLDGTEQTIPEFSDVLKLFDGQVPLIVELKSVQNYQTLCKKTCDLLDHYQGPYCLESFDPRCIRWLRKNRPALIRGQLSQNYFKLNRTKLGFLLKFLLSFQMLNFLTLPDFVAYKFEDRDHFSNCAARGFWKLQGVTWTIKSQSDLDKASQEGWISIFEGFYP